MACGPVTPVSRAIEKVERSLSWVHLRRDVQHLLADALGNARVSARRPVLHRRRMQLAAQAYGSVRHPEQVVDQPDLLEALQRSPVGTVDSADWDLRTSQQRTSNYAMSDV